MTKNRLSRQLLDNDNHRKMAKWTKQAKQADPKDASTK